MFPTLQAFRKCMRHCTADRMSVLALQRVQDSHMVSHGVGHLKSLVHPQWTMSPLGYLSTASDGEPGDHSATNGSRTTHARL